MKEDKGQKNNFFKKKHSVEQVEQDYYVSNEWRRRTLKTHFTKVKSIKAAKPTPTSVINLKHKP